MWKTIKKMKDRNVFIWCCRWATKTLLEGFVTYMKNYVYNSVPDDSLHEVGSKGNHLVKDDVTLAIVLLPNVIRFLQR